MAAQALAPVAAEHQLIIGYGDGPEAGLLAVEGTLYAGTESMIGYMLEQELGNLLPSERPFATLLTMVEIDARDPALKDPTQLIGPAYAKADADRLAAEKSWVFKQDGKNWRRAVPSPEPKRIFELRPIRWLLQHNTIVIAAGGGIPTMYEPGADRQLVGVECVIDADLAWEALARELAADVFVLLTDAEAVYVNWGRPTQAAVRRASPASLEAFSFAAGSMGSKVHAACRFAVATGRRAAIGALPDLVRILAGAAGTTISIKEHGMVFAPPPQSLNNSPRV
jgi:carbamate kinase